MTHMYENAITKPTSLYSHREKENNWMGSLKSLSWTQTPYRPHMDTGAMLCILSKSVHLSDMEITVHPSISCSCWNTHKLLHIYTQRSHMYETENSIYCTVSSLLEWIACTVLFLQLRGTKQTVNVRIHFPKLTSKAAIESRCPLQTILS